MVEHITRGKFAVSLSTSDDIAMVRDERSILPLRLELLGVAGQLYQAGKAFIIYIYIYCTPERKLFFFSLSYENEHLHGDNFCGEVYSVTHSIALRVLL